MMSRFWSGPKIGKTSEDLQRDCDPDGLTWKERALVNEAQDILERARARKAGLAPTLKQSTPLVMNSGMILTLQEAN